MDDIIDTHKSSTNDILSFDLPPVTEKTAGFIADPDMEWGEDGNANDDKMQGIRGDNDESEKRTSASDPFEGRAIPSDIEQQRGILSGAGEPFDPAIHHFPPSETKLKKWRKKTRKKLEQEKEDGNVTVSNALFAKTAQSHARLYAGLHTLPFGEGGQLEDEKDISNLALSLERYYQTEGLKELSPGWEVLYNAFSYSFYVAQKEKNIGRTKMMFSKISDYGYNLYAKLFKKPKRKAKVHNIKTGEEMKPETEDKQDTPIDPKAGDGFDGFYSER